MDDLIKTFPPLSNDPLFKITSPQNPNYNCIAWAVEDATRWWWPDTLYTCYWPDFIPREESVFAFKELFSKLGYEESTNDRHNKKFQKVAIYGDFNKVKHATRQLSDGSWTSKLGNNYDISHSLKSIEGQAYGQVVSIFQKKGDSRNSSQK